MTKRTQSITHGSRKGFTLVELLVVVSISGLVIGVVGASLAAGIRAWQMARTFGTVEAQALVGVRIIKRDVMNTFAFYAIPFKGSRREMTFPAIVDTTPESESPAPRLGSVSYRYNRYERILERQVAPLVSDITVASQDTERLVRDVEDLVIRYGEGGKNGLSWEASWDNATNHPEVVEIELTVKTDTGPLVIRETIVAAVPTIEEEK
jgi:prepilin-type N-terminal cleavage/methylation domain-containing protein